MCLPNLLKSRPSKCNKSNNQHVPTINELSEGVILLNQFNGNVEFRNESQELNGTYLIKFSNMSITINNTMFISQERSTMQVLPAILQPMPEEEDLKEILSLQMMKDINIDNIDQIELLHNEKSTQLITNYTLMTVIAIIVISFIVIMIQRKSDKKIKIINNIKNIEEAEMAKPNSTKINIPEITTHEKLDMQHEIPNMITSEKIQVQIPRRKFYETPLF